MSFPIDRLRRLRKTENISRLGLVTAVYQVSVEYAMIETAAEKNLLIEKL